MASVCIHAPSSNRRGLCSHLKPFEARQSTDTLPQRDRSGTVSGIIDMSSLGAMAEDVRFALPVSRGRCDDDFMPVREEFERNFAERGELGASLCVMREGEVLVDLFGGLADETGRPWTEDTLVVVFSATKGATALCAHVLASRGELDLDSAVTRYWPEFRGEGRDDVTVRMLLNHQAGLPGISEPLAEFAVYDFDEMVERIRHERPLWRPGAGHGYHAMTFGWLVGEVVRRVSTLSIGAFFGEAIARPLSLDFWIGLPASEEHRVATTIMDGGSRVSLSPRFDDAVARGEPLQVSLLNSTGRFLDPGGCDAPGAHAAEIPAAGGITNARGLAHLYAPLSVGDEDFVGQAQLVQMISTESAAGEDRVTFDTSRFSAGFQKASVGLTGVRDQPQTFVVSEAAFGHCGLGGAVGFADPQGRFSFGYAMNRHDRAPVGARSRYQSLIDATYRCMGYSGSSGGKWH